MRRKIKSIDPAAGTHIPVLKALMDVTEGRIVELGGGMWSTTFLHWACWPDRKLVTYEHNEDWFRLLEDTHSAWHDVVFVEDWDALDLSAPCSIALVDSEADRRRVDAVRLQQHATFVVAHDADYGYYDDVSCFKFKMLYTGGERKSFGRVFPSTYVFSNTRDPRQYFPESHVH